MNIPQTQASSHRHCHPTKENPNHGHHRMEHEHHITSQHGEHQSHCGMNGMHSEHHSMMIQDFKKRFWISLLITLPILILSPMIQDFLHFSFALPGNAYLLFLLSTIIYFYGGWPFIKGLYDECKNKNSGMMTQHGLLIRNRTAFENSRKITTLVFDKTGTLTKGSFNIVRYESLNQMYSKEEILKIAASLEQNSEHPIAMGIIRLAKEKNISFATIENFQAITGQGVTAQISGKNINLTNKYFDNIAETTAVVLVNEEVVGFIALADEIREESFAAINIFKKNNIRTIMLTGDNKEVAKLVSEKLGIDDFYAGILPHQKLDIIKKTIFQHLIFY